MTIRRKVLLSLGLSMIGLLALALFFGGKLRLDEVLARDDNATRGEIVRVIAALHNEINTFDRSTNTVSFWADASLILFPAARPSPTTLEVKGAASTFILHQMDILGFINPEGQIARARQFDREAQRELPLPPDFAEQFEAGTPAMRSLTSSETNAWVMTFAQIPYLFVSHAAAVNALPDLAKGALVVARKIDKSFVDKLALLSDLPLKILPVAKSEVPDDVRKALDGGTGRRSAVYPVSATTIAGIIQANDAKGRPALVMSFEHPRFFYLQYQKSWNTFTGIIVALGLLVLLLGGILIDKLAISRISKLAAFVKNVDTNAETAAVVPVEGADEIAGLAVSINGMLESLHGFNLERHDLIQRLESDSLEDALTGLYNRRGFLTIGREYLNLSARNKNRMHLLFLDMDNLKQINDTFGHAMGDEAIVRSAEIIKAVFRGSDIKSRLGGDEFAIFPIAATPQGLKAAINRFHEKTAEFNRSGVCPFTLSFSAGVAGYDPENPSTIDDLLARADKRMYEDKRRKGGSAVRG